MLTEIKRKLERNAEIILKANHAGYSKIEIICITETKTYACTRTCIETESAAEFSDHKVVDTGSIYIKSIPDTYTTVYFKEVRTESVLIADLATITYTYTDSSWLSRCSNCKTKHHCCYKNDFLHNSLLLVNDSYTFTTCKDIKNLTIGKGCNKKCRFH